MFKFEIHGDIVLINDFWDCSCETDYINRKAYHRKCNDCGCEEGESPDSRADEVLLLHEDLSPEEKVEILRAIEAVHYRRGLGTVPTFYFLDPSIDNMKS